MLNLYNENGEQQQEAAPDYYYAIDSHNYGNGSYVNSDPTTWGDSLANAPKLAIASAVSGALSFYNSGVAVANFFGADAEEVSAAGALSALDDDLGKYYAENKETADVLGFIASSFIPGLGAVKILNSSSKILGLAETGLVGNTLSKSTGLLSPKIDKYIAAAAQDIKQGREAVSLINANTLKAIGTGFGQAALESTAFELAVAATMFKSPVLEDSDFGDIAKNILTGTVLGGGIFGAVSAVKVRGQLKSLQRAEDLAEMPFKSYLPDTGLSTSDKIIAKAIDIEVTPSVLPEADGAAKLSVLRQDKIDKLKDLMRLEVNNLAKKDVDLGNVLADRLQELPSQKVTEAMLGSKELGRIGTKPLDPEGTFGFLKLSGEGAGNMYMEAPKLLSLADKLKDSKSIDAFVKAQKFSPKVSEDIISYVDNLDKIEARYAFTEKLTKIPENLSIHENDIPMLEAAWRLGVYDKVKIIGKDGFEYTVPSAQDFMQVVKTSKEELAYAVVKSARSTEYAGKVANIKTSYIEGVHSTDIASDLFAKQAKDLSIGGRDSLYVPDYAKISYDTKAVSEASKFELDAMAYFESKYKLYQEDVERVLAKHMNPQIRQFFPRAPKGLIEAANSEGAGAGLFTSASGNYGSVASFFESVGKVTSQLLRDTRDATKQALEAKALKLANNTEAALEYQKINDLVASTAEQYILNKEGTALIAKRMQDYYDEVAKGVTGLEVPKLQQGAPEVIKFKNEDALEMAKAYIRRNGNQVNAMNDLNSVRGYTSDKNPDIFYPVRVNPKDYQHYVFVVDDSIQGAGHVSMIHAATAEELKSLVQQARNLPGKYKIIDKEKGELYKKARLEYEYERTLNSRYIDNDLKRAGINSSFIQKTDPTKITQDLIESVFRRDDILSREMVTAKYEREFAELANLSQEYSKFANSRYGSVPTALSKKAADPYGDYIKTALYVSKGAEYPYLTGLNTLLDSAVSKAWGKILEISGKAVNPAELEKVNEAMVNMGIGPAYKNAAEYFYANHPAPKGVLNSFIRTANSIIANLTLNFDPLNAAANMINSNVLLGTETNYLIKQIKAANKDAAGELSKLISLDIPEVNAKLGSASKLIANAYADWFGPNKAKYLAKYKAAGFITDEADRMHSILDELILDGTESAAILENKKLNAFTKLKEGAASLAAKGTKITGNEYAEQLNRFVAARTIEQLTELGVKYGVIKSQAEAFSYVNTFVNRTQGNYLAAQRPMIFQGPIGQSLGLFQTYMFNMMQNMFRYVEEGSRKDIGMLLGLQGVFNGLAGLPAYEAINTHIVGTAAGNRDNKDLYNITYDTLGKTVGDLVTYGLPSTILQTNLYARGDINPRQLSIVPLNPADFPVVSIFSKAVGNLVDTAKQLGNGGEVGDTLLTALERNGLNRPLAGMAIAARGLFNEAEQSYSTTGKGNLAFANDLISIANVSRIVGGRPLDEAMSRDAVNRYAVYQAYDKQKRDELGKAVKTTLLAGDSPSQEQLESFMEDYVAIGGKQKDFNKWMVGLLKSANSAQANKIIENLDSPYSRTLQTMMGGGEAYDEYNLQ